MAATIYDIAKITGYNPGTVSRALNGDARVAEKTREKIQSVGLQLGYVPNLAAKILITGRSKILAVVSGSWTGGPMNALMMGTNRILMQRGYLLMSLLHNNLEQFRMCMNRLKCGFCDGAILHSPPRNYGKIPEFEQLRKSGYPLVCFDQWIPDLPFPVVTNDARKSIALLTEKFLETGVDGAFLRVDKGNTVGAWRHRCAVRLLRKAGIPCTDEEERIPELIRERRIRNLGIFADSPSGLDALEKYLPTGRNRPRCTGGIFDPWNRQVPAFISPAFRCVQDIEGESELAIKILFDMMDGKEIGTDRVLLPPKEILTT